MSVSTPCTLSQGLAELGWTIGRNVRLEYRWYAGNAEAARKYAAELVALAPDVVLASGTLGVTALHEIESGIAAFARIANGGLIVTGSALASVHHRLITKLAAEYTLPAIYSNRLSVVAGGLIAYGPSRVDQYRRAVGYIDRILKGEKPADLPVEAPTKYELVVNLKTAKALGLDAPPTLLAIADEVIE